MALIANNAVTTPNPNTLPPTQTQAANNAGNANSAGTAQNHTSSGCFMPMNSFGSNMMMTLILQVIVMLLQQLQGQEQQGGQEQTGCQNGQNAQNGNPANGGANPANGGGTNTGAAGGNTTTPTNPNQPVAPQMPQVPQTSVDAINDQVTVQEGQTVNGNLLDNDTRTGGTQLQVDGNTQPTNGTVTVNNDGSFTYTPNPGFSGQDSFEYTICDEHGKQDTAKVDITVDKKPDPVGIDGGAKIWGDPHFVGAEGGKYDVQGEAGKTYNILSDSNFQINSTFTAWGNNGATVMGEIGATMGDDQVQIGPDGGLTINGEAKGDGTYELDGGTIIKEGRNVTMQTAEYEVTAKSADSRHGDYLNLDFASENVNADGIMPHGLWGQTADGDGEARNGDKGAGAQGGGAIEKLDGSFAETGDKTTVKLYEVDGIFDTKFENFNQFDD